MKIAKQIVALLTFVGLLAACNITKKVPEGAYLFRDHDFKVTYPKDSSVQRLSKAEFEDVVRIRPTNRWLLTFLKIRAYNVIDQEKMQNDIQRSNKKTHEKNLERIRKNKDANEKRMAKARARGDSLYVPKRLRLRDTLTPRKFHPYWLFFVPYSVHTFSEAPVLLNTTQVTKSTEQLKLFLARKGYYHATVSDTIIYDPKIRLRDRKKQAIVEYRIETGAPHTIDSLFFEGGTSRIQYLMRAYLNQNEFLQKGDVFDRELLDDLRYSFARMLRDETFYDFSPNHVIYKADTTLRPNGVNLTISILPKSARDPNNKDSIIYYPHRQYKVDEVVFHILDTAHFEGNYLDTLEKLNLSFDPGSYPSTLDTFFYKPQNIIHAENRVAQFCFNGEMKIRPDLLETKNYLEHDQWYRSYYLDRSYSQMLELDVFQSIQPVFIDKPDSGKVDIHYYLIPSDVQVFGFEPKATNSNGFLGVSASINYKHRNVLKLGGKFIADFSAGIENQPPLGESATDRTREQTFEIGPTVKLVLPGLIPISFLKFSKRQTTTTEFSAGFNYQHRREFDRQLLQFNYLWRWRSDKTQTFQMGLPLVGGFKLVRIDITSQSFQDRLDNLNDLFLKNAYSNQLIFNDFRMVYAYSNERIASKTTSGKNYLLNYDLNLDLVGNTVAGLKTRDTVRNELGQKMAFGVPFSQFVRIDNDVKFYRKFFKGRTLAMRLTAGLGYTYGNSNTAMPFDYAFFAGGSNDNRGWRARELSPGSYQYHKDPNRTVTQIGDIRLGGSIEYRFKIPLVKSLQGAWFSDFGNIWTFRYDPNRIGAQITGDFYKHIALAGGFGLRYDLSFLIVRFDVGIPIHNPAMSNGARWIWNSRDIFEQELDEVYGQTEARFDVLRPFVPKYHFAIGFPF